MSTEAMTTEAKQEAFEDLYDLYAIDKKRATGGVPLKIGGTTFMIAKMGNPRYATATAKGYAELFVGAFKDKASREGEAWAEASEEVLRSALVKHVIVGWDKLVLKGKVYEGYSEEAAEILKGLDDFLELVGSFAANRSNYAPTITEEDQKN